MSNVLVLGDESCSLLTYVPSVVRKPTLWRMGGSRILKSGERERDTKGKGGGESLCSVGYEVEILKNLVYVCIYKAPLLTVTIWMTGLRLKCLSDTNFLLSYLYVHPIFDSSSIVSRSFLVVDEYV